MLFLLKGEQIRGWAAVLAQLSILSPVGYALLYAGRMPILFVILLTIAAVLVRLAQGRRALPEGHHLFVKMIVLVLVFGIYSSAIWASRRNFCTQMNGVVRELQQRLKDREADLAVAREQQRAEIGDGRRKPGHPSISSPGAPSAPEKDPLSGAAREPSPKPPGDTRQQNRIRRPTMQSAQAISAR